MTLPSVALRKPFKVNGAKICRFWGPGLAQVLGSGTPHPPNTLTTVDCTLMLVYSSSLSLLPPLHSLILVYSHCSLRAYAHFHSYFFALLFLFIFNFTPELFPFFIPNLPSRPAAFFLPPVLISLPYCIAADSVLPSVTEQIDATALLRCLMAFLFPLRCPACRVSPPVVPLVPIQLLDFCP